MSISNFKDKNLDIENEKKNIDICKFTYYDNYSREKHLRSALRRNKIDNGHTC